ncbi:MAG: P-loop NTPase, partial [Planctomycetota bacterium]
MSDRSNVREQIEAILRDFPDPETGRGLGPMGQIRKIEESERSIRAEIGLTTYSAPLWEETRERLADRLRAKVGADANIEINLAVHERPPEPIGTIGLRAKSVVAIGSGKGGVGKSTVAASLALEMQRCGCRVGLMDADLYGPSIPHLLGANGQPAAINQRLQPVDADGMKVMS